jgi:hypothetical protein
MQQSSKPIIEDERSFAERLANNEIFFDYDPATNNWLPKPVIKGMPQLGDRPQIIIIERIIERAPAVVQRAEPMLFTAAAALLNALATRMISGIGQKQFPSIDSIPIWLPTKWRDPPAQSTSNAPINVNVNINSHNHNQNQ